MYRGLYSYTKACTGLDWFMGSVCYKARLLMFNIEVPMPSLLFTEPV